MHATTESAEITAQLPSKPRSDIALTALYSAALGPVHLSRYLPIFARFDEAGRTTTSWNWAASSRSWWRGWSSMHKASPWCRPLN